MASGEHDSRPCWPSLATKKGTSTCRSSMWWRSGGSSTVLGKNRSSLVRSPCARWRSRVTATHRWFCREAVLASCSAEVSAFSCRALSTSTCRITSEPSPSSSSRRARSSQSVSAASAASRT